MEPKGSLPHSKVPAYPEPARSSPYPHIQPPEDPSQYYPPIYAWVSQVSLSFPHQNPLVVSPLFALHAPPLSFFSVLSPERYWVRSSDR